MVRAAYEHKGPVYMRFSRYGAPVIHDPDSFKFEIGKGEVLREGTDVALIANGLLVAEALEAADILAEQGISARVIDIATVKPLDEELVLKAAHQCKKIVTCEEHSVIGGLYSDIAALTLSHPIQTTRGRYGGGVKLASWFHPHANTLSPEQEELLQRMKPAMVGDDLIVLNSILDQFSFSCGYR